MSKWQGRYHRNQIIRGAAEILALDRELRACQPHEWRLHTLARQMLTAIAKYAPRQRANRVTRLVIKVERLHYANINAGTVEPRVGYVVVDVTIGTDEDPLAVSVKSVPERGEVPPDAPDLLDEPALWTDPYAHAALVDFLRLDGMACWPALEGPWLVHDRADHVVHRAARAALACERAKQDVLFWNPPFVVTGRPSVFGRTVDEVYVQPWRARFAQLLVEAIELETQVPDEEPRKIVRRFLDEPEEHWTLELGWAIMKASHELRLDCPPEVLPLSMLRERGELTIEQGIVQFLVDHPAGPGIRAVRAAELLGKTEKAVTDMLADIRKKSDLRRPRDTEPPWEDWLANKDGILIPTAMRR